MYVLGSRFQEIYTGRLAGIIFRKDDLQFETFASINCVIGTSYANDPGSDV